MVTALNTATSPSTTWAQDNISAGATGASYFATNIGTLLAAEKNNHVSILYTIGVNDFGTATEAAWIADIQTVADAVHTRWPTALFYLAKPWKRGFNATADTYAGWVDTAIASRAFMRVGPDERTWLKGADDGSTMTTDGIHYSTAGQAEATAQWKTILGY